jgi:hypothetical protein
MKSRPTASSLSEVIMKHTALLFLSLVCLTTHAQDHGFRTAGREFYLGYLHPTVGPIVYAGSSGGYQGQFKVYALVSSSQENEVRVSYYNTSGIEGQPEVYKISAGTAHLVLDRVRMRHDTVGDRAEFLACHITSKRPVSIQYLSTGPSSCGTYLALPVYNWGKKYVIASYNDLAYGIANSYPYLNSGIFTIIAAYDGTVVSITPTAQTAGGHIGVNQGPGANGIPKPYTVTLARGQCYFVRSGSSRFGNADDISGSIVEANHPIAVIAGHENAHVGDGAMGDGGSNEIRDFMIEQMIPVEYWDNAGIISIPYRDGSGIAFGIGENLRAYVADMYTPSAVLANSSVLFLSPYTTVELSNRTSPISFSTVPNTARCMAVEYDMRSHGTAAPYTAPSMCTIIPKSQWSTSYAWSFPFPGDNLHGCARHFVTIIAEAAHFNDIMVTIDNTAPRPIGVALKSIQKSWNTGSIPEYPELKAVTYSITPAINGANGRYSATSQYPFMVYHIGNRGSSTHYLNCVGSDGGLTYIYSYASPGGASLFNKDIANAINVTIDTLCEGGWKICATDSNTNGGIRYVSLLDDPNGNLFPLKSYQHSNVSILTPNDPLRIGEIMLSGDEQSYCFTIGINDPGKDAYAPVIIYDKAGNYRIIELRQSSQKLILSPDPFANPDLFTGSKIGVKVCTTFTLHNKLSNTTSYQIVSLSTSTPQFIVELVKPLLPAVILPGDSLVFDVCFEANDTLLHRDTIHLTGNCLDLRLPLAASTVRPILVASDITFGNVYVGKTVCKLVTLKNTGQALFTMQGGSIVQSGAEFAFDSASFARFPFTMAPGATETLKVCYTPDTVRTHSAWISWQTDITPPFAAEQKAITNLSGQGLEQPGAVDESPITRQIHIRPNPARDKVTVEAELTEASDVSIAIYDVLGREVLAKSFDDRAGMNMLELPLPKLADGMYYLRVNTGSNVKTFPLEIKK